MTDTAAQSESVSRTHPRLSAAQLRSPRRRKVVLPIALFVITCCSTFYAGAAGWGQMLPLLPGQADPFMGARYVVLTNWGQGLIYMVAVLAILFAHEMGHFIATLICRIPASLPFFIPFPFSPIGTLGAVIGMAGHKANRRQIFDIGVAGPIAGLFVAIPVLIVGLRQFDPSVAGRGPMAFDCPLIVRLLISYLHPQAGIVNELWVSQLNPMLMAAWVGLLITGLNMVPVSQLDGGHVVYCLFGKKGNWVARGFLLCAIAYVVFFDAAIWMLMIVLVTLMGVDHPPTSDDNVPLGWFRTALGYASLSIPLLCFPVRGLILQM